MWTAWGEDCVPFYPGDGRWLVYEKKKSHIVYVYAIFMSYARTCILRYTPAVMYRRHLVYLSVEYQNIRGSEHTNGRRCHRTQYYAAT